MMQKKISRKLDITQKAHIDCYKLMTEEENAGTWTRYKCPKCDRLKQKITGRKVYCRKSTNIIEVICDSCRHVHWITCPDWWC